jgi:hypothetical protein
VAHCGGKRLILIIGVSEMSKKEEIIAKIKYYGALIEIAQHEGEYYEACQKLIAYAIELHKSDN